MSTITVVRKNGAVAIAADTLWKDGSTMQRADRLSNPSKILRIGDSYFAFTGSGAWSQVIRRYFSKLKEPPDLSSEEAIFDAVLRMHPVLKKRYGINPDDGDRDAFESSRFCMLLANPWGAFAIYPDRSISEFATFYSFGSGFEYALGAMQVAYPQMERPEDIARTGVEAASEFDEDTGLPVETYRVELAK